MLLSVDKFIKLYRISILSNAFSLIYSLILLEKLLKSITCTSSKFCVRNGTNEFAKESFITKIFFSFTYVTNPGLVIKPERV